MGWYRGSLWRRPKAWNARIRDRRGLALLATLLVLVMVGLLVSAAMSMSTSSVRGTSLVYNEARVFNAAEGGAEAALAQVKIAIKDGSLDAADIASIAPPSLPGFNFDSFAVRKVGTPKVETITDGPYAGLYSLTQYVEVFSQAMDGDGNTSAVILAAKAQAIPIFQFGVFFEEDLEATNGPPLEFVGRVHSNGNIYLSSANAWYREVITTPQKVFHDRKDHHRILNGVYINNASGAEVALDFDSRTTPDPEAFKAASCAKFDCRLQTDAFGVTPLRLPLPQGVPAYELIRAREVGDPPAEREVKFAWNADMYVQVNFDQIKNSKAFCGRPAGYREPEITITRPAGLEVPSEQWICEKLFRFNWEAFKEGRERYAADVLDVNLDELKGWIGGELKVNEEGKPDAYANRRVRVLYISFIGEINPGKANKVDNAKDGIHPVVRLLKTTTIPNRMTVATEWPLYVWGDYNKSSKKPAALVGDGITMLSNAWKDQDHRPLVTGVQPADSIAWANYVFPKTDAGDTEVYAAILAGHWPTPMDHQPHDPSSPYDGSQASCYDNCYGGGIENFPRFLEEWTGKKLRYRGALISPFTSQKTTGTWNGTYYNPPQRDWSFDTDFRDPVLLPPGTPNVGHVIQMAMRDAF